MKTDFEFEFFRNIHYLNESEMNVTSTRNQAGVPHSFNRFVPHKQTDRQADTHTGSCIEFLWN